MTGVAVIEHRNSIKFNNIALINSVAVSNTGLNSVENVVFTLDTKKIKQVQEELSLLGLYKGKNSGRFNRELKKSLIKYQEAENFETNGIITKEVYEKIIGIEIVSENPPDLPFNENNFVTETSFETEETAYPNNEFVSFWERPVNLIHISQPPKPKDKLYAWGGKDDFLFIGVFMILVAVSLVAAFFFA
jgi:hypothetical protein